MWGDGSFSIKPSFCIQIRWKPIQPLSALDGSSTAVNMRSQKIRETILRAVSSLSWSFFQKHPMITGLCFVLEQMLLAGRRSRASSKLFQQVTFQQRKVIQFISISGRPSVLTGCQIINKTLTSLKVECHEGNVLDRFLRIKEYFRIWRRSSC